MKKITALFLSILLLFSCHPKTPSDSGGVKDTIDTVAAIYDTLPYITHRGEMGVVEIPTTAPLQFRDNGVREVQMISPMAAPVVQAYPTRRAIYLDRSNTIYNNPTLSKEFAKYCKDNFINEVHFYSFTTIVQSSANFPALASFMRLLYDNGVKKRIAVLGSSSTTSFNNFFNYTSDTTRKPNGINLELEWWNGVTTFSDWINTLTTLNNYCDSKTPDLSCSFYMGWFKNMGSETDSSAARKMWQLVDWIDIHDYQDGKVGYTYGSSRYEGLAKGAKSLNKVGRIDPIFSTEEIEWGAANNFQGYYLGSIGYILLEKAYVDNFNTYASAAVKANIKIGEAKYFTWRYNKLAVPPKP